MHHTFLGLAGINYVLKVPAQREPRRHLYVIVEFRNALVVLNPHMPDRPLHIAKGSPVSPPELPFLSSSRYVTDRRKINASRISLIQGFEGVTFEFLGTQPDLCLVKSVVPLHPEPASASRTGALAGAV
jgi:hypothetical protein